MTESARREVAGEVLREFGVLRFRALGGSMVPSVWPGDVLTVERFPVEDALSGDIILFSREDRWFAHRVVENKGVTLLTKGDALSCCDPPVQAVDVLGKVTRIERGVRGRILLGLVFWLRGHLWGGRPRPRPVP